jgi:hypothetical protein
MTVTPGNVHRLSDQALEALVSEYEDMAYDDLRADEALDLAVAAERELEQRAYAADPDEGVREGTGNARADR